MQSSENGLIGAEGVPVDEKDAYAANYKAHRKGISYDKVIKTYDEWADNYDKDLCPGVYNGPEILAKAVGEQYVGEEKQEVRILDVAAGTGRVGEELQKLGFRIDALEPSERMLEILRQRGLYENDWHDSIGFHQTQIKDGTYDCVVSAGGMGEGHMPISALDEMIRVLKTGGLMIIVMREEYLSYVNEYVDKLEPHLKELEALKKCKKVSRTVVPNYSFNKNGIVFVYQAL
ncbi:methyltransferase-like protein 27 isoform X2 [Hetaerina americana]|uniref:methyltransferase-like protein 27 isoform X2 n=1 Tax=Hetaerina americana TaxID=62018 RepID=UPI003A7F2708